MRRARSAASTRRTPGDPLDARGGGAPTLVASAQGGRAPHFARNDSSRIYLTSGRGLQSIDISGLDRRTLFRIQGSGPGNNPPSADEIRLSPDGSRAFVNLQGKHFLVPVPRAGRETVDIKIQGRADGTPVPVKRMSLEGGDYLRWSSDGATMTWALGAQFFRQTPRRRRAAEDHIVVELPRARPSGSVLLSGARVDHDERRRGDRARRRCSSPATGSPRSARTDPQAPAGTRTIDVHGQDDHARASWTRTRTCGRRAGCTRPRSGSTCRQPRLRRDDDARSADVDA